MSRAHSLRIYLLAELVPVNSTIILTFVKPDISCEHVEIV
jgi:hypothetical protein